MSGRQGGRGRAARELAFLAALAFSRLALAHGDLHDQIDAVTQQIEASPRDATLFHKRGELHRAHAEYRAALADYARAERLDPTLQVVHLSRGRAWLESGKPAAAVRELTKFLDAQPDHAHARELRARALAQLGKHEAAERDFATLLASAEAPPPDLLLERAANLRAAGRPEAALAALEEGFARIGALVVLDEAALALELELRRFDAALARLDRMLAGAARKETLLARKASVLERSGRTEDARAARALALAALEALPEAKRKQPAMLKLQSELRDAER